MRSPRFTLASLGEHPATLAYRFKGLRLLLALAHDLASLASRIHSSRLARRRGCENADFGANHSRTGARNRKGVDLGLWPAAALSLAGVGSGQRRSPCLARWAGWASLVPTTKSTRDGLKVSPRLSRRCATSCDTRWWSRACSNRPLPGCDRSLHRHSFRTKSLARRPADWTTFGPGDGDRTSCLSGTGRASYLQDLTGEGPRRVAGGVGGGGRTLAFGVGRRRAVR